MSKLLKELYKKCKQCIYNEETKLCNYYTDLAKNHYIDCEFDQRKVCKYCNNFDINTNYCKLLTTNCFKDENVLRICNKFILNNKNT